VDIVSGGTDSHLMLWTCAQARHWQVCRGEPRTRSYDATRRHPVRPGEAGGHLRIRLGSPAGTTRASGSRNSAILVC